MKNKKLILLPLVAMLTACGGSKIAWQEASKDEFAEVAASIAENLVKPFSNLKKSFTATDAYKNKYEGMQEYRYSYTFSVDFDGPSETFHLVYNYDWYDFNSSSYTEPEQESEEAEYYISHIKDVGVVVLTNKDGEKTRKIAIPEDIILDSGETEEERHNLVILSYLQNIGELMTDSFWLEGFMPELLDDELAEPSYWCEGADVSVNYFLSDKEGFLKGELIASGKDEDDISEGDAYVCDVDAHITTEFNDGVLLNGVYDYQENGLYYETPDKSYKYEYLELFEYVTNKYKQPKLPSLNDYELID